MNKHISTPHGFACGVALLLSATSLLAQTAVRTTILQPSSQGQVPGDIQAMLEEPLALTATQVDSATNGTPKEPLSFSEEVEKMEFNRTAAALFAAVKSQQGDEVLSDAEQFRMSILLSDWIAAGEILGSLGEEDARVAYLHLLASLAKHSQSVSQFFKLTSQSERNRMIAQANASQPPKPGGDRPKQRSLFLSDDLYAVIDAAPFDLDASHLPDLAALVKLAIDSNGRADFLRRLEVGFKGIGGTTGSGGELAAQLLSEIGWMADAGPYLPLEREAWDEASTLTLVLTMEYFTQTGIEQRDERQLKRAAELSAFMMQTSRFGENERGIFRQATDRFVKLLPALEPDDARQLVRENFLTQPAILTELIFALGESGQQARMGSDLNHRGQSLATQGILLEVLAGRKRRPPEAANVLVMNWLAEAEATYRMGVSAAPDLNQFNNPFIYRPPSYYNQQRARQVPVLRAEVVVENAPSEALVRRLNRGLAQRVDLTLLKLNLLDPQEPATLEMLDAYLEDHPGQEKKMCEEYLRTWVHQRAVKAEDPNIVRMRAMGYNISRQQQSGGGIPLTRLRQNQNMTKFKELLEALRELSPEPINPQAVVRGFMEIHSGAEVYRAEDIETIFGPAQEMDRDELMQLVTGMRTRLREQWQDPKIQQDAGTNRTEKERKDEVSRGYVTALDLVRRGLSEDDANWKQFIVRGQLFFDAAEYEFSREIELTDYVDLREESFSSYRKAAAIYAASVLELPKGQWTLEPYQQWFFVMLGASDLSQLTRAAARSDPGLQQIGDAMRALPGEAAEGHLNKFGEMLADLLTQVPGNMRQRFLSAGLEVVGKDHPSAQPALESLNNYQELLDEVRLRVTVDGPGDIGHGQPFGLFVSLEHTRQLARESGGFTKYLQNMSQQNQRMMIGLPGAPQNEHRDLFSKNIHAALDETFEISSITFHDADVRPLDLPREGWQETPMAYVLLRAKEAAVDRIPSIQLDMDFSDTSGRVVLPVRSQVEPIDAKAAEAAPRPCNDLTLAFTMDEREWDEGRVVVEVTATGQGVIPPHTTLFDYEQEGFDVEVADNGLSITEFVSDGETRQPRADRNWQFTYTRKKDLRGDAILHFPIVMAPGLSATVEYQHYRDADLVDLTAGQAGAGVRLSGAVSRGLRNVMGGVVLAALGLAVWLGLRSRRRHKDTAPEGLTLPQQITPFSVVAFLRRIQQETGTKLDQTRRQELKAEISGIEAAFFQNPSTPVTKPDLQAVARKWMRMAM